MKVHINLKGSLSAPLPQDSPCHISTTVLQAVTIPPDSVKLVQCANPWSSGDVLLSPSDNLPWVIKCRSSLSTSLDSYIAVCN